MLLFNSAQYSYPPEDRNYMYRGKGDVCHFFTFLFTS